MKAAFESCTAPWGVKPGWRSFSVALQQGRLFHSYLLWLLFQQLPPDQQLSVGPPGTTGLKLLLWGWLLGELSAKHPHRGRQPRLLGGTLHGVGLQARGLVQEFTSPDAVSTSFLVCKF